jgi:hypothetical protein
VTDAYELFLDAVDVEILGCTFTVELLAAMPIFSRRIAVGDYQGALEHLVEAGVTPAAAAEMVRQEIEWAAERYRRRFGDHMAASHAAMLDALDEATSPGDR